MYYLIERTFYYVIIPILIMDIMVIDSYFCKNTYFGVSVFENTPLEGEEGLKERGARMAAVGLLGARYTNLHQHIDFLQEAAR
jgi:hypothetical protein